MHFQYPFHQEFSQSYSPRVRPNYIFRYSHPVPPPWEPHRHPFSFSSPSDVPPPQWPLKPQRRMTDRLAPRRSYSSHHRAAEPVTPRELIEVDSIQAAARKRKLNSKGDLEKRVKLSQSQEGPDVHEVSSSSDVLIVSSESPKVLTRTPKRTEDLYQELTSDIRHFDRDNSPSQQDIYIKLDYCNFLSDQVSRSIHNPRFVVFGSSLNGFSTQSSDLDITLLVSEEELLSKNPLRRIHRSLCRNPARISSCQLIAAKIPIVMFEDLKYRFEVDISINNHSGIRNTFLLRTYSRLDARVRPLVIVAKEWAKSNYVCNSKSGLLSSYALNLMVLFFLQHAITPQVLPSLQHLFPDTFNSYLTIDDIQEVNVKKICKGWSSENEQSVGELILKFFEFYANIDFRGSLISVRTGHLLELNNWDYGTGYKGYINIEEPYTRDNAARSVYLLGRCKDIINEFKRKHKQLSVKGKPKNINSIFSQTL